MIGRLDRCEGSVLLLTFVRVNGTPEDKPDRIPARV
jgi:hypothetical protein